MIEAIQYDEIKEKKRYFPFDINTSSKLYTDKDVIYKILYRPLDDLKEVLEYIDSLNMKEVIKILSIIYDKDEVVGYSFVRYYNYKSLNKNKFRDFDLKKQDCYQIIRGYRALAENNIECMDSHQGNILLNSHTNDIKLCDLDSFCICDYEKLENVQLKKALMLSIAYLYNLKYWDIKNIFYSCGIYEDSFINRCLNHVDGLNLDMTLSLIDSLEQSCVSEERKAILVRKKELSKMGYPKFDIF